jgi:PHD-finger
MHLPPVQAELFCLCQQPYHADTAMVSCDVCEEWYHMGCVRLSAAAARSMRKYTCPVCASFKVGKVLQAQDGFAAAAKG